MKLRLFISTFALVFFAELGDKTQLTALAVSAAGDKWVVFAAASTALAASTLLAVLGGRLLSKLIPPRVIKVFSGLLFLVFGGLVLWRAFAPQAASTTVAAKGFAGVFALVFLAELGDKTQLTAMARSAAGSKWVVFLGATAALTLSTFIAVIFGDLLQTLIRPHVIKTVSGGLFLVFGGLILAQVIRPPAPSAPSPAPTRVQGLLARAVLEMAMQFEAAAADDYRRLAAECEDPALRNLLIWLEREETSHLERVRRGLAGAHSTEALAGEDELPSMQAVTHNVSRRDKPILEHAIEHELATAEFYAAAARAARVPQIRDVFDVLANEERRHARRLQEHLDAQS